MNRLSSAQTKNEIVEIVRDYLRDWGSDERIGDSLGDIAVALSHEGGLNPTERFILAKACARAAELDAKPACESRR